MRVLLLGTGPADGWPNPWCRCPSCEAVRRLGPGHARAQSSALVDGRLLLDAGPDVGLAAARHGVSLAEVRTILLTHAHTDHVGPQLLLWRSYARLDQPLDVVGPQAALDLLAHWIGPTDPVRLRPAVAGDRLTLDGYDVRVLAAAHGDATIGPGVLYDVASGDGSRLLYATDTGPLPADTVAAVAHAGYDLVLLEETFGDRTGHGLDHLDLTTFPVALAELRRVGAVNGPTRVVPIHLGHGNPPPGELTARLAEWGVELHPDGAIIDLGPSADSVEPARASRSRRVLVTGGARSGKSRHAESLLLAEREVTYVATSPPAPHDEEWLTRVASHQGRRPAHWSTVETTDVTSLLNAAVAGHPPLLVDCLTLWLTAAMTAAGCWDDDVPRATAQKALDAVVDDLLTAWSGCRGTVVAVTNEVGDGVVPATPAGRWFRDEMGRLNAAVAARSDDVWLTVAGLPLRLH